MAKLNGVKTLDMVNGEITKVEYDGAVYESVGKDDCQAGDIGLRIKDDCSYAKIDEFYPMVNRGSVVAFKDDVGDLPQVPVGLRKFVFFRKVEEPLKVGDYVKVIKISEAMGGISIGRVYQITNANNSGFYSMEIGSLGYGNAGEHFVRATEEEIAADKTKEAQRKLEAKWGMIERKIDEYKKGDIVRVLEDNANGSEHKAGDIGEIATDGDDFTDGAFRVETPRIDFVNWVRPRDIELITPVEARFDR